MHRIVNLVDFICFCMFFRKFRSKPSFLLAVLFLVFIDQLPLLVFTALSYGDTFQPQSIIKLPSY